MPADARPAQQGERLQKALARAGVASRRKSEEYIVAGRVQVNGQVVTELGTRIRTGHDRVTVDGKPVNLSERPILYYYLLYKPVGYLSTVSDPFGRPTAMSLIPSIEGAGESARLYPVGRLDLESEGLLLLTNDGALAQRLMHPRYEHEKEYLVMARGQLTEAELDQMRRGVLIEDNRPAKAEVEALPPGWRWRGEPAPHDAQWLRVVLKEGRKRQIRYMVEAVGGEVARLIRVRMADLALGELRPGEGRWLKPKEARALRRGAGLAAEGDAEEETPHRQPAARPPRRTEGPSSRRERLPRRREPAAARDERPPRRREPQEPRSERPPREDEPSSPRPRRAPRPTASTSRRSEGPPWRAERPAREDEPRSPRPRRSPHPTHPSAPKREGPPWRSEGPAHQDQPPSPKAERPRRKKDTEFDQDHDRHRRPGGVRQEHRRRNPRG